MIKMFPIRHYGEIETYDPDVKQGGLFTGYINSGFSIHVTTEEEKRLLFS
jgi:hypothetical protein